MNLQHVLERSQLDWRESQLLLSRILDKDAAFTIAHLDYELTPDEMRTWRDWHARAAAGEPVAYILGEKEFYGRLFVVDARVLIPRPETEQIVNTAISFLKTHTSKHPSVLELGVGSGAITVSIATELSWQRPTVSYVATDISPEALEVAQINAETYEVAKRITFRQGDLFEPVKGERFDLIVANLPYLPTQEARSHKYEPYKALDGGRVGDEINQRLLSEYKTYLNPGGLLIYEGYNGEIKEERQIY